jgi:hypothetical protein
VGNDNCEAAVMSAAYNVESAISSDAGNGVPAGIKYITSNNAEGDFRRDPFEIDRNEKSRHAGFSFTWLKGERAKKHDSKQKPARKS